MESPRNTSSSLRYGSPRAPVPVVSPTERPGVDPVPSGHDPTPPFLPWGSPTDVSTSTGDSTGRVRFNLTRGTNTGHGTPHQLWTTLPRSERSPYVPQTSLFFPAPTDLVAPGVPSTPPTDLSDRTDHSLGPEEGFLLHFGPSPKSVRCTSGVRRETSLLSRTVTSAPLSYQVEGRGFTEQSRRSPEGPVTETKDTGLPPSGSRPLRDPLRDAPCSPTFRITPRCLRVSRSGPTDPRLRMSPGSRRT